MAREDLIKYIRTDKNGTKIFHDYTCPRCGGEGYSSMWMYTGGYCYACGGSGMRSRPKVVKEYTDEYLDKLEARRREREEKRLEREAQYAAEHPEEVAAAKAEQERKEAEWRKERFVNDCKMLGIGADGIGYVLTGNTYPAKDKAKASGGKWISQAWVCPVEVTAKDVKAVRIDVNGFIDDYGYLAEFDVRDLVFCISQRGMSFEEAKAQVAEWNANK